MAAQSEKLDIRAYRRVIHPELSKGGTCGLCIAASDRIYFVDDLLALPRQVRMHHVADHRLPSLRLGAEQPRLEDPLRGRRGLDGPRGAETDPVQDRRAGSTLARCSRRGSSAANGKRSAPPAARVCGRRRSRHAPDVKRVLSLKLSAHGKAHELAHANPAKWGAYAQKLDARIADLRHQLATVL